MVWMHGMQSPLLTCLTLSVYFSCHVVQLAGEQLNAHLARQVQPTKKWTRFMSHVRMTRRTHGMTQKDKFTSFVTTTAGKHVTRRSLVKGAAGVGAGAAASAVFAVPMIDAQEKGPVTFWTTHSGIGVDG